MYQVISLGNILLPSYKQKQIINSVARGYLLLFTNFNSLIIMYMMVLMFSLITGVTVIVLHAKIHGN